MRHEEMAITPALAEQFLKANVVNRKHIRASWVAALAAEMKQGTFITTHQGIAFNTKGELLDGQHRLHAIIQSGCTVTMDVTFDCPAATAMDWPVDRGAIRSVGDVMGIHAQEAAMVDAILALWKNKSGRFTTLERRAAWELFKGHLATISEMCNTARKTVSKVAIKLPVLLRILQHGEQIGIQYRALVLMEFELMWPSVQSLTRQLTLLKKAETTNSLMARTWIAFDPEKAKVSRIQVNDPAVQMAEMREALLAVGLATALEKIAQPLAAAHEPLLFPLSAAAS